MSKEWLLGIDKDGIVSPCYKCEERKPCCHDSCPKYAEYLEEIKRFNANRKKVIDAYYDGMYMKERRKR